MKTFLHLFFYVVAFLVLPLTSFSQGGDNAASAASAPITLPFSAAGTTCGHADNYDPLFATSLSSSGSDWLYYFCATTTGTVDILLNNPNTTDLLYPAIMAYSTTPNASGSNWMGCSFDNALPNLVNYVNSKLTINVIAGQCYYIMIDEDFTDSDFDCFAYNITIQYHVPPPVAPLEPACTNIGYDNGNFTGWIGTSGQVTLGAAGALTPTYTPMFYNTTTSSQHLITSGAGLDPIAGFPIVNPSGGTNSIRLGDGPIGGAAGASIEQKFQVTASNALFVYYYAVVMQDGGSDHTNQEQPFFKTDVFDCTGNPVACGQYLVTGGPGIPGFTFVGGTVYYKNWSPVAVDLTPFIGTCVTVRYTVGDCIKGAHFAYAYIDANCSPLAITGVNQICPTKSTTLTAPLGLFSYSWTPGGATTQSITVSPTVTTTYSCQLTSYTNCQTFLTYSVSLFPAQVATASSQTICNGTSATLTSTVSSAGGSYSWTPGSLATANITVSPSTTTSYTCTYTDLNGCKDTALAKVTVNPIPVMVVPSSTTICNNTTVATSNYTSSVAGTTYNWTNSNTSIGLGASGVGNTPSFTSINAGTSLLTGVVSVTPSANSCVGLPLSYSINVNPIPTVNAVPSASYCNGANLPVTTFTGNIAAATYSWTNTNSTIGLASTGSGNIGSFTAVNAGTAIVLGVISVTPTANTCIGNPQDFTLTINPAPLAPTVAGVTVCPSNSIALTATAPGATYTWYDAPAAGNLLNTGATYTLSNLSSTTNYYVKTTNALGCVSPFTTVTATVLNFLTVSALPNQTICAGGNATLNVTPTGAGFTYSWSTTGTPGFSSISNPNVAPSITTTYSAVVTSTNGCSGTGTTQVVVNALPTANAGNPISFCDGQSGIIGAIAVNGYSYSWLPTLGLSNSTLSNPIVILPNTGSSAVMSTYTLTVTQNGCQATNTVQVTVNALPVSDAGNPITLCAGQSGTIGVSATAGYSYSWLPTQNLSSSTVSNPLVTPANIVSSTVYTVTTTEISTSCQSKDIVMVSVLPLPTVFAGASSSLCEGVTNIPLAGTVGGSANSGLWSGGTGNYNPNNTALTGSYTPTASEYANGSVTLTLTAIAQAPCQNIATSVQINFYKKPVINFIVDNPRGCPEHCVVFTDNSSVPAPDAIETWEWNFGDGGSSNAQNPAYCYTQSGLYTVTLSATTNHQCTNQLVIPQMIEVYPQPIASFIPSSLTAGILDPTIHFLNTSQGADTYFWNFGDGYALGATNTSTLTSPDHSYTYAGTYNVNLIATSVHGCVDRASINVEIIPEFTFYIPNAFTPGREDGLNDIFTGAGIGIEKYEIWVFDRWGANIFYSDDIQKGWDGKMRGKSTEVKQDVYIWKVKIKDVLGKGHDYVGHVTLIR